MSKNELINKLTDFLEEKVREIYEVPISEHVCVQIWETTASINIPYVTDEVVKIRIDGLLGQLRGITNITSYLRSKTHFVKNILKNGICCKNLSTKFFQKEIDLYANNRKFITKFIDSKQKKVASAYGKLNDLALHYMLDLSEISVYNELKTLMNVFHKFNNSGQINRNLSEFYEFGYSCELNRGVVTIYIDNCPIFEHFLYEGDFDSAFVYPDMLFENYKNMVDFFEKNISEDLSRKISDISKIGGAWIKSKRYFELEKESSVSFKLTANEDYTNFFINSISLSSDEVINIYEKVIGSVQTKSANFNKLVFSYLNVFLDPINYMLIKEIAYDDYNDEKELISSITESILQQKYVKDMPAYNPLILCTNEDVANHLSLLKSKGYVTISEDDKLATEKSIVKTARKMLNMYSGASTYINSYLTPNESICSADNSHNCSEAIEGTCPICGAPLKSHISEKKGPMKKVSNMSVFEIIALLNINEDLINNIDDSLKDEILELVDSPIYSQTLKDGFEKFFEKYHNGEFSPLLDMKYIFS